MARKNQKGSPSEEMVSVMKQCPVSLMNSLLWANELANVGLLHLEPQFDCPGTLKIKPTVSPVLASTVRTAVFKNFPIETPPSAAFSYPVVRMTGSRIPRASFNFPLHLKCKFGESGCALGHLSYPHGFCLGPEDDIVVADTRNHRIQVFDIEGVLKYKFGFPGTGDGLLWFPRKVALMSVAGMYYVVGDKGEDRSRLQLFTRYGFFVRRIPIPYIEILAGLAVTPNGSIIAVDSVEPTVFILNLNGVVLNCIDCRFTIKEPSEVAVLDSEIFVCDFKGHCVAVYSECGAFLRRFGGPPLTNYPNGIEISKEGYVLVGDSHGNKFHLVAFTPLGDLLVEFECPSVRVSRCCGLKITSQGFVVTAAKNNHHMIVTEPLN